MFLYYCELIELRHNMIILWLQNTGSGSTMDHARHTPRKCMMKPMVLHSNRHLHAVTPAKEEQWRAWNNVNSV